MYFRKLLSYSMVIRSLAVLPTMYCEYIELCAKYGIKDRLSSRIKRCVLDLFCTCVF